MENTTHKIRSDLYSELIREISAAAKQLGMYPSGHPAAKKAILKPYNLISELFEDEEQLVLAIAEGKLVVNSEPLDDRLLHEGLGKIIADCGILSLSFQRGLTVEHFEAFLQQIQKKDGGYELEEFLEEEKIQDISLGKFQYQLVGEDERVVDANLIQAANVNSSSGDYGSNQDSFADDNDLKDTVVEVLRNNPIMALQALTGNKKYSPENNLTNLNKGVNSAVNQQALTAEETIAMAALQNSDTVLDGMSSLNDNDLLQLLASSMQQSVGNFESGNLSEFSSILFSLRDYFKDNDNLHLLPKLKEILGKNTQIDKKYLNLILNEESSPKTLAHKEIERIREKFESGDIDPKELCDLHNWLEMVAEKQYTEDFINKLYDKLERELFSLTMEQREALLEFARTSTAQIESELTEIHLNEIRKRLENPDINLAEFTLLTEQAVIYYQQFIEQGIYGEAAHLLEIVSMKIEQEIIYAEGISECAEKTKQIMTSASITEKLITVLAKDFEGNSKNITKMLEQFNNMEAIMVMAGNIDHSLRGIRILIIRILSGFGQPTVNTFRIVFSDRTLTEGRSPSGELPDEKWYKLRNLILVLGNIQHPISVEIVKSFIEDQDVRIVKETLNSLEKLDDPKSLELICKLLTHTDRDIHVKALSVVSQFGDETHFKYVKNYFTIYSSERLKSLPVLLRLDKLNTLKFLMRILLDKSESFKSHSVKSTEELNEIIVGTFIQVRDKYFDEVLRVYTKSYKKTFLGHFRKPASVKFAERYLRTIKS